MRTALVLRGLARFTDDKQVEIFKRMVGENTDIFICTWDETGAREYRANRYDYSTEETNVNKLLKAFNPVRIKVYSLSDFRDTQEQTLKLIADKHDLDISQNKAYQHTKNTLLGQMFCFQQGVKLVQEFGYRKYERIVVSRFDYNCSAYTLPRVKPGEAWASGSWHAYYNDFCHIFHSSDISGFTKIYDSLADCGKDAFVSPYIKPRCSCAEIWYWNYIKKHLKLDFRNANLGGQIRRA